MITSTSVIVFILMHSWQVISIDNLALLEREMRAVNIIPKILSEPPKQMLEIEYLKYQNITPGNLYNMYDIKHIPNVTWVTDPPPVFYTLAILGIDEYQLFGKRPCDEKFKTPFIQLIRWLIVNIPGNDISKGSIIHPYRQPIAPTGYDRIYYLFVVYKQTRGIDTINLRYQHATDLREFSRGFKQDFQNVSQFMEFYHLKDFVAANFFEYELTLEEFEINNRHPQRI